MKEITVTELARGLSDFINRASYRGETFVIMRGGKAVAQITPTPTRARVIGGSHCVVGVINANPQEEVSASKVRSGDETGPRPSAALIQVQADEFGVAQGVEEALAEEFDTGSEVSWGFLSAEGRN